jgi:amino acid permease
MDEQKAACQFYVSVFPISKSPSAAIFFKNFLGVPIFFLCWIGHKVVCRTSIVDLEEVDLLTGRRPEDGEEKEMLERYAAKSRLQRLATYVHF